MTPLRGISALLTLGFLSVAAAAVDSRDAQVQSDVRVLLNATYAGDVDTVLRLTNPVVLEALGGQAEARRTLTEAMQRLRKISLKIDRFEFPEPPRFVEGTGRTYAVVPTRLIVSAGPQTVDRRSFQVGVLVDGSKGWTYLEGPKFAAFRAEHFADFPSDYEYPETTKVE